MTKTQRFILFLYIIAAFLLYGCANTGTVKAIPKKKKIIQDEKIDGQEFAHQKEVKIRDVGD